MRKPAPLEPWLSSEELLAWLRESPDRAFYQKRLAVWLTYMGPYHAHQVAEMLGVSKQAVWLWIGQYNKYGPSGLNRSGRGGRRWSLLSWVEEEEVLHPFRERAAKGEIVTAKAIWPALSQAVGQEISLAYVYKLLHRHGWRKLGPRPRHVKSDQAAQMNFKKNSPNSSRKR
ncbi:MAG: winged helix-turn-helix domain-containing protein [Thermodesulfobacteriota bacterium]